MDEVFDLRDQIVAAVGVQPGDVIVEFTPEGEVLRTWDLWDVVDVVERRAARRRGWSTAS